MPPSIVFDAKAARKVLSHALTLTLHMLALQMSASLPSVTPW
jgi:hypothetical protein